MQTMIKRCHPYAAERCSALARELSRRFPLSTNGKIYACLAQARMMRATTAEEVKEAVTQTAEEARSSGVKRADMTPVFNIGLTRLVEMGVEDEVVEDFLGAMAADRNHMDNVTYNILLKRAAENDDSARVESLLQEMEANSIRLTSVGVMKVLSQPRLLDDPEKMAKEIARLRKRRDVVIGTASATMLCSAVSRRVSGMPWFAYIALRTTLVLEGMDPVTACEHAEALRAELRERNGLTAERVTELAELAEAEFARSIQEEMAREVPSHDNLAGMYNAGMGMCVNSGRQSIARSLWESMARSSVPTSPFSYLEMIRLAALDSDTDSADMLLQAATTEHGPVPKLFEAVAQLYGVLGDRHGVHRTLFQCLRSQVQPTTAHFTLALRMLPPGAPTADLSRILHHLAFSPSRFAPGAMLVGIKRLYDSPTLQRRIIAHHIVGSAMVLAPHMAEAMLRVVGDLDPELRARAEKHAAGVRQSFEDGTEPLRRRVRRQLELGLVDRVREAEGYEHPDLDLMAVHAYFEAEAQGLDIFGDPVIDLYGLPGVLNFNKIRSATESIRPNVWVLSKRRMIARMNTDRDVDYLLGIFRAASQTSDEIIQRIRSDPHEAW